MFSCLLKCAANRRAGTCARGIPRTFIATWTARGNSLRGGPRGARGAVLAPGGRAHGHCGRVGSQQQLTWPQAREFANGATCHGGGAVAPPGGGTNMEQPASNGQGMASEEEPAAATCPGCGVVLQTTDPEGEGYVVVHRCHDPRERTEGAEDDMLLKAQRHKQTVCQRCFRLKHYNKVEPTEASDEGRAHLNFLKECSALIVHVVDVMDIHGTLCSELVDSVGRSNPILVVVNKADLLLEESPDRPYTANRMLTVVEAEVNKLGWSNTVGVALASAQEGTGVAELRRLIDMLSGGHDVYLVGCANVGKSSLMNQLLHETSAELTGEGPAATVSTRPGTTLGILSHPLAPVKAADKGKPFKFSRLWDRGGQQGTLCTVPGHGEGVAFIHDTPGLMSRQQVAHFLMQEELRVLYPAKPLAPRTFALRPGQCIFLGGVARLDFMAGSARTLFTVFASERLHIHATNMDKAQALYLAHAGNNEAIFSIPLGGAKRMETLPRLRGTVFSTVGHTMRYSCCDINLSNAGWVAITTKAGKFLKVRAWTLGGVGLSMRDSLAPMAVQMRGKRLKASGRQQSFFGGNQRFRTDGNIAQRGRSKRRSA